MDALAGLLEAAKACLKPMVKKGLVTQNNDLVRAIQEMEAATKEADGDE